MNYAIMTDSSSNLTPDLVREAEVQVIPLHCLTEQGEIACYQEDVPFDGKAFYDALRQKSPAKTSMVNVDQFLRAFEPVVQAGKDILYVAMSSGISGTCAAGMQAAKELMKKYPGRVIRVVDTLGASFGEGIFVLRAALMRKAKESLQAVADWLEKNKHRMCQYFTVDDLMFLRRGGRISGITAFVGSIANIKPLLAGNNEGCIISYGKTIGRKKSLQALADLYEKHADDPMEETVAIAHSDCEADALYLAEQIKRRKGIKDILIRCYEPGTGAHVGPGAVALFFFGKRA